MNFLSFLTSGASLFNCKLQSSVTASKLPTVQQLDGTKISKSNQQGTKNLGDPVEKQENIAKKDEDEKKISEMILAQQQQLINQYMHLNLQLMNQKISALESSKIQKKGQENQEIQNEKLRNMKKKIKKINRCGHEDKQHYAKGMCNNCYHKYGRTKKPWNCPHQKLYAVGMCQNCYINKYNKKRRQQKEDRVQDQSDFRGTQREKVQEKGFDSQQGLQQQDH